MAMNREINSGYIGRNEHIPTLPQILSSDEIGKLSEVKAACVLRDLPAVDKVTISRKWSRDDMLGRDLTVQFKKELGVENVWAQVKTSEFRMIIYKNCMERMLRRKNMSISVDEWFLMNRLVLIVTNGYNARQIADSFGAQMDRINRYARKHGSREFNFNAA